MLSVIIRYLYRIYVASKNMININYTNMFQQFQPICHFSILEDSNALVKRKHAQTVRTLLVHWRAYHLEWWILNEDRFGELSIVLLRDIDAFPGQGLQDPVVILIVIVRIRVYVGQREAVKLRIGKRVNDLRFQMLLFLWTLKFL